MTLDTAKEKKQIVWIWNHYATNTFFDRGGRHYWMAKYLIEQGYDARVFCASTIHNSQETVPVDGAYSEDSVDSIPYIFLKTPSYQGNGKSRVQNMLSFYRGLLKNTGEYARKNGKPSIILASSVHPLTCVAGIKVAKRFEVPCICEIRDLWPESIVAYTKHTKNEPIIRVLYRLEKWIYKKADVVVFTFPNGYQYLIDKGWDKDISQEKVKYVNTGVDMQIYHELAKSHILEDADLDDPNTVKIVYTGSIRKVNNLLPILQVAKTVKEKHPNVRFLLFGDGEEKPLLQDLAKKDGIDNVLFKGMVGKQYIPGILNRADILLINAKPTPLSRYGESWNKLFEYMASGKPILCNVPSAIMKIHELNYNSLEYGKYPEVIDEILNRSEKEQLNQEKTMKAIADQYDCYNLMTQIEEIIQVLSI